MNKIEILAQELTNSQYSELVQKQDYPALAEMLNKKPLINNPIPQTQVPAKLKSQDFVDAVSNLELDLILKIPGMLTKIESDIESRNTDSLKTNLSIISKVLGLSFTSASKTKIETLLAKIEPDPSYKTQILGTSRAEELKINPVSEHDVQAALNPGVS